MLKNDKGEFLLHVVDQDDARELMKVGAVVKLQRMGHGLALRDGRGGWGLGR